MFTSRVRTVSFIRKCILLLALAAIPFSGYAQSPPPIVGPSGSLAPEPSDQLFGFYFDADEGRVILALAAFPGPGRVFAYKRAANGEWLADGMLPNPNPAPVPSEGFGVGVALDGKFALVRSSEGGYHLFERSATGWTSVQYIAPPAEGFNNQVRFENGIAVICGPSQQAWSVHVYRMHGKRLVPTQVLQASDAAPGDGFGVRLGLSPSARTLLIGAASPNDEWAGSAYVFKHRGQRWIEQQKLQTGVPGALFGDGVATTDDFLVIGASSENSGGGAAYVYREKRNQWQLQQRVTPPLQGSIFAFGNAIAIGAGRVAIGAHFSSPGIAFVYRACNSGICPELAAPGATFFAEYVAIEGNEVMISSPTEATVYLYELSD